MKIIIYVNDKDLSVINALEKHDGSDGKHILKGKTLCFAHERTFNKIIPCMIAYNTYITIKEHIDESRRK